MSNTIKLKVTLNGCHLLQEGTLDRNIGNAIKIIGLGFSLAQGRAAFGEQPQSVTNTAEESGFVQNEVVVKGRLLSEEDYESLNGLVAVVGEEQLRGLDAHDLAAALRRIPDVTTSRYAQVGSFGGGDGGAVFVRGQGAGRPGAEMVTLFDGMPRFVGIWNHPLLDLMPPDLASRIEVYKDPQPVEIGNMGFAAINMVPRRRKELGFEGRVSGSLGFTGDGTGRVERVRASQGGAESGFDYYVSGGQANGQGTRDNSAGSAGDLYGRVGYSLGEVLDVSAQILHQESLAQDPGPESAPSQPGHVPEYSIKSDFYVARATSKMGAFETELGAYLDRGLNTWTNQSPGFYTSDIGTTNYGWRARETMRLVQGSKVILGYDDDRYGGDELDKKSTGSVDTQPPQFANSAPWVFVSQEFGDTLKIVPSAGVRYNTSRFFGNQWGYQGGLEASYLGTKSWARYSRAYNLPGVYTAVFLGNDAWKDLSPEVMDSYEAGLSQDLPLNLAWDGTWWYNDERDALRIYFPPPPPLTILNVGTARTKGLETNLRWKPAGILDAYAGACYADPEPVDLPVLPRWSLSGGLNLAWQKFKLGYDIQYLETFAYLDARTSSTQAWVPGYTLMNARLGYTLPKVGILGGEAWLACENLADVSYYNRPGYPMPARTFTAGLDVFF